MSGAFDPYHEWLGIPPEEQPANHYRLLGIVLFESKPSVIETAADRQMAHLRNYQIGPHSRFAPKLLNEVAAAKVCLLDPRRKALYDEHLRKAAEPKAPSSPPRDDIGPNLDELLEEAFPASPYPLGPLPRRKPKLRVYVGIACGTLALLVAAAILTRPSPPAAPSPEATASGADPKRPGAMPAPSAGIRAPKVDASPEDSGGEESPSTAPPPLDPMPSSEPDDSWDQLPVKPARLTVDNMKSVPFSPTDAARVPEYLRNGTTFTFRVQPEPDVENGMLRFSVERTGEVFLAPTWESEGNLSGDWYQERFTRGQLAESGWEYLGECPWDTRRHLFRKTCSAGESYAIRTNKFWPPVLILRRPGARASALPLVETVANVSNERAVPAEAVQRKVEKALAAIYHFSEVREDEERLRLAHELLSVGGESEQPEEQYVLYRKAVDLAADAVDAALALEAIDALVDRFDVDATELRASMLIRCARNTSAAPAIRSLLECSPEVVEKARETQRYELAFEVLDAVYLACLKTKETDLRKEVYARRAVVKKLAESWKQVQDARAAMEKSPDDPRANEILGWWCCLEEDDWDRAVSHWARSGEGPLAELARRERAAPTQQAETQTALADAWWDLAQEQKGRRRVALLRRAGHWYEQLLPQLSPGLPRVRVRKRLGKIEEEERAGGAAETIRSQEGQQEDSARGVVRPGNVALASGGATVFGVAQNASALLDGKTSSTPGASAESPCPCQWIITLDQVYRLQEIRLKLWDRDGRFFRYAIATSSGGTTYLPLVERRQGQYRGWQRVTFSARPVKSIKLTGLHDSAGEKFMAVECEAYCIRPKGGTCPDKEL